MGSIKNFKKTTLQNTELQKLQQNIQNFLKPFTDYPIVDGVLLKEVCLEPDVANNVTHKLGRKALGYIIVRKRQDARIWDLQDVNSTPNTTFALATSHTCTVDVWIF